MAQLNEPNSPSTLAGAHHFGISGGTIITGDTVHVHIPGEGGGNQVRSRPTSLVSEPELASIAKFQKLLPAIDCESKHKAVRSNIREWPATEPGPWLLSHEKYTKWKGEQSSPRLLLLSGIPGAGKTVLCSRVIDDLRKTENEAIVVFFYCENKGREGTNPKDLFASLVHQMLAQPNSTSLQVIVRHQLTQEFDNIKLLVDLILELSTKSPKTIIVIDALDECNNLDYILRELKLLLSRGLHVFVSSRNNCEVRQELGCYEEIRIHVDDIIHDVREFGKMEVKRFRFLSAKAQDIIVDKLTAGAQGSFLWAVSQMEQLRGVSGESGVERILAMVPPAMKDVIVGILESIDSQQNSELLCSVLQLVIFARRPITLPALAEYAALFEMKDNLKWDRTRVSTEPQLLVDGFAGLLTCIPAKNVVSGNFLPSDCSSVMPGDSDIVIPFHASVKEVLFAHPAVLPPPLYKYSLRPPTAIHDRLARLCIRYLDLVFHFTNNFNLEPRDYPFADYALREWLPHIHGSGKSTDNHRLVIEHLTECDENDNKTGLPALDGIEDPSADRDTEIHDTTKASRRASRNPTVGKSNPDGYSGKTENGPGIPTSTVIPENPSVRPANVTPYLPITELIESSITEPCKETRTRDVPEVPSGTVYPSVNIAIICIEATQQIFDALFGNVILSSPKSTKHVKNGSEGYIVEAYVGRLTKYIKSVTERDHPVTPALRDHLKNLRSELRQARKQLSEASDNVVVIETVSLDIALRLRQFLFESQMAGHISPAIVVEDFKKKRMEDTQRNAESAALRKLFEGLPRVKAAYNDYVSSHPMRVSCFEGTRRTLLKEMGKWVSNDKTNILVLSGLAGAGKSTIAQTIAERADNVGLLGASFFFSTDEAERRSAETFFTAIAFQLCVYDPEFASAIENALMTGKGKNVFMRHPVEQLETLILEPLREHAPRRVLIVIDSLDECNEEDRATVLKGLHKLVLGLPSFKVVLTVRSQQHVHRLYGDGPKNIFHLRNFEDSVVDDDIRLYLKQYLSREMIQDHFKDHEKAWNATDDEIEDLVKAAGGLFIIASMAVLFILDKAAHDPGHRMKQLLEAVKHADPPLTALDNCYTAILRSALPEGCDLKVVARYQSVIGAIILIQTPLPVEQLSKLIGYRPEDLRIVLRNLRSVILIDDTKDVPRICHRSFSEYIQDPERCKDEDLRINSKSHHTKLALNCFTIMNQRLRQNIFELSGLARFMDNGKCSITEDRFSEKLPFELSYACT